MQISYAPTKRSERCVKRKRKPDSVHISESKCKQVMRLQRGASAVTSGKGSKILCNFLNKNANRLGAYKEEGGQRAEKETRFCAAF